MICCGLHRDDIHLYSGKTAVFYMHRLLLYEVGTEKRQSLNFSRQIHTTGETLPRIYGPHLTSFTHIFLREPFFIFFGKYISHRQSGLNEIGQVLKR